MKDVDIYKTFIKSMDNMVQQGEINSWRAFPYDWRLDYEDIITNGIKLQDSIEFMILEIEKMASSSKTGKVSIVTHSNGGLLAKVLINELKSQGKETLVDKLVMVAPPQLGTPKAMSTILHGEEDPNFIFKKELTRGLGEYMKSAYNLLPSQKYFETILGPVVKFNSNISTINNLYSKYGDEIDTYEEMVAFLEAESDQRSDPNFLDVLSPNVLSSNLLDYANNIHNTIDDWTPPANITITKIAGWGVLTTSGIEYFKNPNCVPVLFQCKYLMDHKTIKTIDGDKTVVTPSVVDSLSQANVYYLNLRDYNLDNNTVAEHSNIMEVPNLQEFIKNIITDSFNLPEYLSKDKPEISEYKNLKISMHSPVAIDAYDGFGNHTGLVKDSNSDNYFVEESIPGSIYEEIGEGKYIYLDHNVEASIKLVGLDTGTFTLQVENQENGQTISESVFADIPTTSNTEGSIEINPNQTPQLMIDIEGDGNTDIVLEPGEELTVTEYLGFIKKTVEGLDINKKKKESIIKRIDKFLKLLKKQDESKVIKKIKDFNKKLKSLTKRQDHKHHHKHQEVGDIQSIIDLINKLLDSLEQK